MDSRLIELPAYAIGNDRPIRKFLDSRIQDSIDRAIRGLGDSHGAVILHGDLDGNASLTTVAKLGGNWSVVMSIAKPGGGKIQGEGAVAFRW